MDSLPHPSASLRIPPSLFFITQSPIRWWSNEKKLDKLIDKLEAPKVDADDLKALCLATISDIDNDSAQHTRAKIEALKLLKEIKL